MLPIKKVGPTNSTCRQQSGREGLTNQSVTDRKHGKEIRRPETKSLDLDNKRAKTEEKDLKDRVVIPITVSKYPVVSQNSSLIKSNQEGTVRNTSESMTFIEACKKINPEVITIFLSYGVDVDSEGFDKNQALLIACEHINNLEIIKLLLEHGAEVTIPGNDKRTENSIAIAKRLVIGGVTISGQFNLTNLMEYSQPFSYDFLRLFSEQEFCDHTFTTWDKKTIGVNKKMFNLRTNNSLETANIFFGGKNADKVEAFLKWVYSGGVSAADEASVREICFPFGIQGKDFDHKTGLDGFRNDMKRLYADDDSKDFTIIVQDKEIKVHRLVMAARSDLFRGMFLNVQDESNQVHDYSGLSYDAFAVLIKYLYTGEIDKNLTPNIIAELKEGPAWDYFGLNPNEGKDKNPYSLLTKLGKTDN